MENKRASKKQKCQINRAVLMQRNFMELEKQARKNITSGALDRRRNIFLCTFFFCVSSTCLTCSWLAAHIISVVRITSWTSAMIIFAWFSSRSSFRYCELSWYKLIINKYQQSQLTLLNCANCFSLLDSRVNFLFIIDASMIFFSSSIFSMSVIYLVYFMPSSVSAANRFHLNSVNNAA